MTVTFDPLTSTTRLDDHDLWFASERLDLTEVPHQVLGVPGLLPVPVQQVSLVVTMAKDHKYKTVTVLVTVLSKHPFLMLSHLLCQKGSEVLEIIINVSLAIINLLNY